MSDRHTVLPYRQDLPISVKECSYDFRQMFDSVSSTYTYPLLANRAGGEALIDLFEKTDRYIRLLEELDLKLVKVVDTHVLPTILPPWVPLRPHELRHVMGEQSPVDVVSMRSRRRAGNHRGIDLTAMHTPGHTDDSYCFRMDDRVFTGDTLIRGTGQTDFQNGDAGQQYDCCLTGC